MLTLASVFVALELITFSPRLATGVTLSSDEYEFLLNSADELDGEGTYQIVREDSTHWLGVTVDGDDLYLKIYNIDEPFNCRAIVMEDDLGLLIIKGVDYDDYDSAYDAAIVSMKAKEMLYGAMTDFDIFSTDVSASEVAQQVFDYLSEFKIEDNSTHTVPMEAVIRGSLDSDDFALYQWMRLTEYGYNAKTVLYQDSEGSLQACAVFQEGELWKVVDQSQGLLEEKLTNWYDLPVLLCEESTLETYCRAVDSQKWMSGEADSGNDWMVSARLNIDTEPQLEVVQTNRIVYIPEDLRIDITSIEVSQSFVFYEDEPYNSDGIDSKVKISDEAIEYLQEKAEGLADGETSVLLRENSEQWIGVMLSGGELYLRIADLPISYNCRARINKDNGTLTVIHGVDYPGLDLTEDVETTASQAILYVEAVMMGADLFFEME